MRKFLTRFSPLLVSLLIGTGIVLVAGEVLVLCVMVLFFREYLGMALVGYGFGGVITFGRLIHMHWSTMGTVLNRDIGYVQFFSAKDYALRNGITMIAWVLIFYFLGQTCMLSAILGTILTSKVAVFTQPITDKFFTNKIFK